MRSISRIQTVVFALVIWIAIPVFAALPFSAAPLQLAFIPALFEATSAFTTTGVTSLALEKYTMVHALWFAILQWLGGFLTLLTVFTIIAPAGLCGSLTQVAIPGNDSDDYVQTIRTTFATLLPAYSLFTFLCFLFLWVVGIPFLDALCLALSTLSTGGFVPNAKGLSFYENHLAEIILMVFMVVGATSAMTHRNLLVTRRLIAFENRESGHVIGICLIVGAFLCLWVFASAENEFFSGILKAFFTAVSLVTTTGFMVSGPEVIAAPYGIIIAVIFVGGATFSTAGGIKLYRFVLICKQSMRELKPDPSSTWYYFDESCWP